MLKRRLLKRAKNSYESASFKRISNTTAILQVVFACALSFIAYLQFCTSDKQKDIMKRQTTILDQQKDIMHKQSEYSKELGQSQLNLRVLLKTNN